MKQKNLFEFLLANFGDFIGGFWIGLSLPLGGHFISPMADFIIFFPIGILLMGTSYYYKFVKK